RHILADAGLGHRFEELNRESVRLAIEARNEAASELGRPPVAVAGSVSTTVQGAGAPPIEVARVNFADQVAIQAEAGVDLFILEMMRDLEQTGVILDAVETTGLPVWLGFAAEVDDNGDPCLIYRGLPLGEAIDGLAGRRIEAMVLMHTEVHHIDRCLDAVLAQWDGPIGVYAHTGHFERPKWIFNGTISPDDYATAGRRWLERGVQVIGGCCGIRPDHIRLLQPIVAEVRRSKGADGRARSQPA
ncbi:MAG: homocysteine S-methyltransferase family protein, partial [Actinomycetota bacterium]